jgi:uncharacterized protein (TIGR03435 family)
MPLSDASQKVFQRVAEQWESQAILSPSPCLGAHAGSGLINSPLNPLTRLHTINPTFVSKPEGDSRMCVRPMLIASLVLLGTEAMSAPAPAFEVASVKHNQSDARERYPVLRNGTLTAENIPLKRLLAVAWGLTEVCISGPTWLESEKFDINAKAPAGTPDTDLKPLLQSLFKERLGVVAHIEKRETSALGMLADKEGIKLRPYDPDHPPANPPNRGGSALTGVGPMAQIANMLTFAVHIPVIDKTGIEGRFWYFVSYAPLTAQPDASAAASGPPDIFTAVQEQLGHRLKSNREPVEFLIVDHAEHLPTEN